MKDVCECVGVWVCEFVGGVVKHFREIRVYREAFNAAMRIFECSKEWPKEERYMMANAEQWCISSNAVREDGVEYEVTEGLTYPHTHTPTNMGENNQSAVSTQGNVY
jgi:hypothetical protein